MSATAFIGIDAGGSRTRVAAETDGRHVTFEIDGVNVWRDGVEESAVRLHAAIARASSDLDAQQVFVVAGVAGAMEAPAADRLRFRLQELVLQPTIRQVRIVSDVLIAHHAAHGATPGTTVVIGTGSVVLCRSSAGRDYLCGGWGFRLGDEGSGYAIGVSALRRLAEAVDAGHTSSLEALISRRQDEPLRGALLRFTYGGEARIQDLAPAIIDMAGDGDLEAKAIVRQQAELLAAQVAGARKTSGMSSRRVALTGGLSANSRYVEILSACLRRIEPKLDIFVNAADAVREALAMAKALAS